MLDVLPTPNAGGPFRDLALRALGHYDYLRRVPPETGARRGAIILVKDPMRVSQFGDIDLLREWDVT